MTGLEETMKRITLIRRRRYLVRSVALGFAAAALFPAAALAGIDEHGAGIAVDPYASSPVSAEDDHGLTAGTGLSLPAGDLAALQAQRAKSVPVRADDFLPPRNVTVASVTAGSATDWGRVALWSAIGLAGLLGMTLVAGTARRRIRVAHP